ncbi:hypothetical protein LY76DRAFT_675483 [Colletotrichum caudatum]|nr:hypothetical protein LY76DRAFT_675483 [Colletotrichum caudatum]
MLYPSDREREKIATLFFGEPYSHRWTGPASKAYFDHHCSLICPENTGDAIIHIGTQALKSHTDVVSCIKTLCENLSLTVDAFITESMGSERLNDKGKKSISKLIVLVAFIIDCSPGATKEEEGKIIETIMQKKSLKAWKLAKMYDIKIRPTNNLLAHLAIIKDQSLELGFEESLALGTLPPRLLLETLLTVHTVLFPIIYTEDDKSYSLLKNMIIKHSFDQEAKLIDFVPTLPPDIVFEYWGSRLAKLHDTIKHPPPTNPVVSRL